MTPFEVLDGLVARGVNVTLTDDALSVDAPKGSLTDGDIETLRKHKRALIRWLRLAEGLAVDDDAAVLLSSDETDLDAVRQCEVCKRYCDVLTLANEWSCSRCDPNAKDRKLRTFRLLSLQHVARARGIF